MITNKQELKEYLYEDKKANRKLRSYPKFGGDLTWRFLISLRKFEYQLNCNKTPLRRIMVLIAKARWYYYSVKSGITIHPNCFGKGLILFHYGTIIVNETVKAGEYVTIQCDVVISKNVTIGNNVYIAPGVKILAGIRIADDVTLGCNAVVSKDINEKATTYVGVPARKLR